MDLAIRVSNRQYCQLRAIEAAPRGRVNINQVAEYNQITLGANKRRGFISETEHRDGVTLTPEGRNVLESFHNADFMRRVASMKFSSFLSLRVDTGRNRKDRR